MHCYREDKYKIKTNYKVHVQIQNIFPNQEERLSQLSLVFVIRDMKFYIYFFAITYLLVQ
jgi:hypothetical protein